MVVRKKAPHIRVAGPFSYGRKFHVNLVDGRLKPLGEPMPDEDVYALFESDEADIPNELQRQLDEGTARFVRIDDRTADSLLRELEHFSYDPEGITFIVHSAEHPYVLCLFGENTTQKSLRAAGKGISALLRQYFGPGRGTAGRRANVKRLRKTARQLQEGRRLKEIAVSVSTTENIWSSQDYVERVKRKLKKK